MATKTTQELFDICFSDCEHLTDVQTETKIIEFAEEIAKIQLKEKLAEFAKFIKEQHTDRYGMLLLSEEACGEFCIESFEGVADEFLSTLKS